MAQKKRFLPIDHIVILFCFMILILLSLIYNIAIEADRNQENVQDLLSFCNGELAETENELGLINSKYQAAMEKIEECEAVSTE